MRTMPGSWPPHELPSLTDDTCAVTSKAAKRYNCIAWAAGNDTRNWWPDPMGVGYWPANVPRVVTFDAFLKAFGTLGYKLCNDNSLEVGLEKIAIFGRIGQDGLLNPTHAALQLESGEWTSKLGPFEDVSHKTLDDVAGPAYGTATFYMSRRRRPRRSAAAGTR
jgi:hypothetical protein